MSSDQDKWFVVEAPDGTIIPGTLGRTKEMTQQWVKFKGEKVVEVEIHKTSKRKASK